MNKPLLLLVFVITIVMSCCTGTVPVSQGQDDELQQQAMPYKMYPTSNMWTFIKLDTRNGKMWQVQFSVKGDDYRFETPLNMSPLISAGDIPGRFELYPTQNMYNFILLDGVDGDMWQVQWSGEAENRAIIPIQ